MRVDHGSEELSPTIDLHSLMIWFAEAKKMKPSNSTILRRMPKCSTSFCSSYGRTYRVMVYLGCI